MQKKKSFKKIVPYALMLAIVGTGVCGSLTTMNGTSAFFTDKKDLSIDTKSGTLDLNLTDNTENHNLDPDNDGIINPGDYKPVKLNVANVGEKSMDVRVVLTLKSIANIDPYSIVDSVNLSDNSADTKYPAVESVVELKDAADKNYKLVEAKKIDSHTIRYVLDLGTLNGSIENEPGVDKTAEDYVFQFYFDRKAKNANAGNDASLGATVYGIQHRNMQESDWDEIIPAVETVVSMDAPKLAALNKINKAITAVEYSADEAPADSTDVGYNGDTLKAKVNGNKLTLYTAQDKVNVYGDATGLFNDESSLSDISALKKWNVSEVTNMTAMFYGCSNLDNIDALSGWNTSSVTDMESMFQGCTGINSVAPLRAWDVSHVANMSNMFYGCSALSDLSPLANWNVSNVTNMSYMFEGDSSLTDVSALQNWSLADNVNIYYMFDDCTGIKDASPLNNWNIVPATGGSNIVCAFLYTSVPADKMPYWYGGATADGQQMTGTYPIETTAFLDGAKLQKIDKSGITAIKYSSEKAPSDSTDISYAGNPLPAKVIGTDLILYTDAEKIRLYNSVDGMLGNCSSLSDISALSKWDVSSVTNMAHMFAICGKITDWSAISGWKLQQVTNLNGMFMNCSGLTDTKVIGQWRDLDKVKTMQGMFQNCNNLKSVDNGLLWTSLNVENTSMMFFGCTNLSDVSGLRNLQTPKVTDMSTMFFGCSRLSDISPLGFWNVSKVNTFGNIFNGCSKIANVDELTRWDISNATDLSCMFLGCSSVTDASALSDWNVSNAKTASGMFVSTGIKDSSKYPTWYDSTKNNLKQ